MLSPLRVIPLGGLGEIGKNMMAVELGDDIIVVDCGVQFPEEGMLGVDLIIPDISYLVENSHKVRAILITHGHEDHIGALPFVLPQLNVPVYAPRLAHALISSKLRERRATRECEVPRVRLLTQFNSLSQGVKFLVDMRSELIELTGEPALRALDREFQSMFVSWFDIGFLELSRITWQTPASQLEKLIEYEAVHAIRSWDDLKNRLDSDRRCYAFYHPCMPEEPLIFVEVALVSGMAGSIQELLDEHAPAEDPLTADTAIFYSISNCQRGLAGVSFGSFLIKRVVDDLAHDLPNLKSFATLSPAPDFGYWLEGQQAADGDDLLTDSEARALKSVARAENAPGALKALLAHPDWYQDGAITAVLRPILMRLFSRYLVAEKRGDRALDRVAHFHLTNGARIERINWLADISQRGLAQSASMMVNYRYKLDEIEKNHENYTGDGLVAATPEIRRLTRA